MKLLAFGIFDSKAELFLPPFFFPTVGLAIRTVSDLVNKVGHEFQQHVEDYTLYQVGVFDEAKGILSPVGPSVVGTLITYRLRGDV